MFALGVGGGGDKTVNVNASFRARCRCVPVSTLGLRQCVNVLIVLSPRARAPVTRGESSVLSTQQIRVRIRYYPSERWTGLFSLRFVKVAQLCEGVPGYRQVDICLQLFVVH